MPTGMEWVTRTRRIPPSGTPARVSSAQASAMASALASSMPGVL